MFTAVLDTNILWPSMRRDVLLSLAVEGLYRPVWSQRTLAELEYCERLKLLARGEHQRVAAQRAQFLISRMRAAFADAVIPESVTQLVAPFGLPDPNDEHVLAAAFAAGAEVIVTDNTKDFPAERLPVPIVTILPAQFARDAVSVDAPRALAAISAMAQRRSDTPVAHILDHLEANYGMFEACSLLRDV